MHLFPLRLHVSVLLHLFTDKLHERILLVAPPTLILDWPPPDLCQTFFNQLVSLLLLCKNIQDSKRIPSKEASGNPVCTTFTFSSQRRSF